MRQRQRVAERNQLMRPLRCHHPRQLRSRQHVPPSSAPVRESAPPSPPASTPDPPPAPGVPSPPSHPHPPSAPDPQHRRGSAAPAPHRPSAVVSAANVRHLHFPQLAQILRRRAAQLRVPILPHAPNPPNSVKQRIIRRPVAQRTAQIVAGRCEQTRVQRPLRRQTRPRAIAAERFRHRRNQPNLILRRRPASASAWPPLPDTPPPTGSSPPSASNRPTISRAGTTSSSCQPLLAPHVHIFDEPHHVTRFRGSAAPSPPSSRRSPRAAPPH